MKNMYNSFHRKKAYPTKIKCSLITVVVNVLLLMVCIWLHLIDPHYWGFYYPNLQSQHKESVGSFAFTLFND